MVVDNRKTGYLSVMQPTPFERAIRAAGNLTRLAKKLGIRQSTAWYWEKKGVVPAHKCIAIERLTGGLVSRQELRPDVFGDGISSEKGRRK